MIKIRNATLQSSDQCPITAVLLCYAMYYACLQCALVIHVLVLASSAMVNLLLTKKSKNCQLHYHYLLKQIVLFCYISFVFVIIHYSDS